VPDKRHKPRQEGPKGAETRRLLLEKAAELFLSQGIGATSLDRIAAAAGVMKGAIYDHFENKTALVFQLFEARGSPILNALKDDRAAPEQLAALMDYLTSMIPPEVDYVSSHNEFNHYISSDPRRSEHFRNWRRIAWPVLPADWSRQSGRSSYPSARLKQRSH
jgi:AcrR family transcriptional regulator